MAAISEVDRLCEVERSFEELFGAPPEYIVRAPGRVNLIGEHTDYNDGFVFPAAIDRDIILAVSPRRDRQVRAYALNFKQSSTFNLDPVEHAAEARDRWSNYLRAMAWVLASEDVAVQGMNCVTLGNVPLGAGLSSSAAMLVAAGLGFSIVAGEPLSGARLALLSQRAEREFVGVNVGIMDQFISALGQKDHALLIDTRSLSYEAVPLPVGGVSIIVADTGKRRGLVDSEYNTRRAECERAVEILRERLPDVRALRDVSVEQFNQQSHTLPGTIQMRARHVVTEDARTLESVGALKRGDLARVGVLMNESHASLRDDYQVSCAELDALVEASRATPGVYGARMTGAGFGGCTVSLAADSAVEAFLRDVPVRYKEATGMTATIYVTTAAQGAERVR